MGVIRLLAGLFGTGVLIEVGDACFTSFSPASDVVPFATTSFLVASITVSSGFSTAPLFFSSLTIFFSSKSNPTRTLEKELRGCCKKRKKQIDQSSDENGKSFADLVQRWVIPVHHVQTLVRYSNRLGRIMLDNGHQVTFEHKQ